MRTPWLMALLTCSLMAQAPRLIHVKIFETNEGLGAATLQPKVVLATQLRSMVEGPLQAAGHKLVSAKEAGASPEGLLCYVHVVELEGKGDLAGWHVNVGYSRISYVDRRKVDPEGVGSELTWVGRRDRLVPGAWEARLKAGVAQMVARLAGNAPTVPSKAAGGGWSPAPSGGDAGREPGDLKVDFAVTNLKVKFQPPAPPYPMLARQFRAQGMVSMDLLVDPEGVPAEATCQRGEALLRIWALEYGLAWRFHPATLGGQPQWARFNLRMPFRLGS